jgi:hypothetical protein
MQRRETHKEHEKGKGKRGQDEKSESTKRRRVTEEKPAEKQNEAGTQAAATTEHKINANWDQLKVGVKWSSGDVVSFVNNRAENYREESAAVEAQLTHSCEEKESYSEGGPSSAGHTDDAGYA